MKLFILTHPDFTGDNNQSLGVLKAFTLPCEHIIIKETDFNLSMLNDEDIVLVAGEHGIQIASEIKAARPLNKITWSGHLFFNAFLTLDKGFWPDVIALPKSAVTEAIISMIPKHCHLVETDGVSHNVDEESIATAMTTFDQTSLPDVTITNCVGIVIAGDAPTSDKIIRCFESANALEQANKIAARIKESNMELAKLAIMVTNGPRTGKHHPETKLPLDPDPHRNGTVDIVSQAFVNELKRHFPGQVVFYNFQYGQTSGYQPMMRRVCQAEKALWFVPAESSSMVTESTHLSAKGIPVVVYTPTSANDMHLALVAEAKQNKLIVMLEDEMPTHSAKPIIQVASTEIAKAMEIIVKIKYLEKYVAGTYPHLLGLITLKQYEQMDWVDDTNKTNEASLAPDVVRVLSFQQQRLLTRLHFLYLLREGDHERFAHNQSAESALDENGFTSLSQIIQNLTPNEYKQLWMASITSISPKAIALAGNRFGKESVPSDSVEFLAKVMTEAPDLYPASQELMQKDSSALTGFSIIFNSGHFRHMMYCEGDNKMFDKLRMKIQEQGFDQQKLNLWFAYWLIDITAFRLRTKDGVGSEYLNKYTFQAIDCLKKLLDTWCASIHENAEINILRQYLDSRFDWITPSHQFVFSPDVSVPRYVFSRIAAMLRVFTLSDGASIMQGFQALQSRLGSEKYLAMLEIFNPLPIDVRHEPTPTFAPALLANLYNKTKSYTDAIVLGLPILCDALAKHREALRSSRIDMKTILNLNGLASPVNIERIVSGEKVEVSINTNGGTDLISVRLELTAEEQNNKNILN